MVVGAACCGMNSILAPRCSCLHSPCCLLQGLKQDFKRHDADIDKLKVAVASVEGRLTVVEGRVDVLESFMGDAQGRLGAVEVGWMLPCTVRMLVYVVGWHVGLGPGRVLPAALPLPFM